MKTIQFIGYLFFRYYSKGATANIPYFSTICAMSLLAFFHLVQILILVGKMNLIPIDSSDNNFIKRFKMLLVMIPISLVMTQLFRKRDIPRLQNTYEDNWHKISNGNIWLIAYLVLSFSLMFVLAVVIA